MGEKTPNLPNACKLGGEKKKKGPSLTSEKKRGENGRPFARHEKKKGTGVIEEPRLPRYVVSVV